MTPCEKLGYKVGDKFKVLNSDDGFEIGHIVELIYDDGSVCPEFRSITDDNTCYLNVVVEEGSKSRVDVKPVSQRTTKPISKSKRQLAQLLIEAGVTQFPEGANWAAQDKDLSVWRYGDKPTRNVADDSWSGSYVSRIARLPTLTPNWYQTVLSRDEFDQIVAETVVQAESELVELTSEDLNSMRKSQYCESVTRSIPEPTVTPTLDQLLQDWRNADDYAQRKQTEADEAAAMRDERWQAVQARAGEMGVTVGRCESVVVDEPELVITDWRDLQVGDEIEVVKSKSPTREGLVGVVSRFDKTDDLQPVRVIFGGIECCYDWPTEWRFIRRP